MIYPSREPKPKRPPCSCGHELLDHAYPISLESAPCRRCLCLNFDAWQDKEIAPQPEAGQG